MELAKIEINDFGGSPMAEHNYPCPVCLDHPAVYNLSAGRHGSGTMSPCWECQGRGFHLLRLIPGSLISWFVKWVYEL